MRRHPLHLLSLLAALALGSGCAPTIHPAETTEALVQENPSLEQELPFGRVNEALMAQAIHLATNRARAASGLPPVTHHAKLDAAARIHARNMVARGFFDHIDPGSARTRSPQERARLAGIANPVLSENIAITIGLQYTSGERVYMRGGPGKFSRTPDGPLIPRHTYASFAADVVKQWMDSPGHRRNILDDKAVAHGAAVAFVWRDGFPAFKSVQNFQRYEAVR